MADTVEERLLEQEDIAALDGGVEIPVDSGELESEREAVEEEGDVAVSEDRDMDPLRESGEEEASAQDDNEDSTPEAPYEGVKEEIASVEGVTVSEVTTQYLAVHQELLLRPLEDKVRRELLKRLLGEESVHCERAEELLRQFPLLSLLHGKHKSQGGSMESFWANVAAAAASGVHLNSPAPSERERERGERESSGLSKVLGTSAKSSTGVNSTEREFSGDNDESSSAKDTREDLSTRPEVERQQRANDTVGVSETSGVTERRGRTTDGDRRAAAVALADSARDSIELDMEDEDDDSLVMEIGEKQSPARYIVSAVMAVIKIVIVLALLREYEAPLLFYLYPLLWVFIFFLLVIRAVQILIANKAIDKANARLATELLPLDPHSDEEEEGEYDEEEDGRNRS